jgi:hypothetical protein
MTFVNSFKTVLVRILEEQHVFPISTEQETSDEPANWKSLDNWSLGIERRLFERILRDLEQKGGIKVTREDILPQKINGKEIQYEEDGAQVLDEEVLYVDYFLQDVGVIENRLAYLNNINTLNPAITENTELFGVKIDEDIGDFAIYENGSITYKEKLISLPLQQNDILILFLKRQGQYLNHNDIEDVAKKDQDDHLSNKTIAKYVSAVNKILEPIVGRKPITNQKDRGWVFNLNNPDS